MRLDNFDLNLLVAFDFLMTERSVTRAAERAHVTQSAMSASLKKLREAFQDEILAQHGRAMIPTSRALELQPAISDAIRNLRSIITEGAGFDPCTSTKLFRIAASDYISTVLLVPFTKRLDKEYPGISLDIHLPEYASSDRLANGEFDLLLTPRQFADPNHPADLLFRESHVVVGCRENPLFAKKMTMEDFTTASQVAVRIDGRDSFVENLLDQSGIDHRIAVYSPSFSLMPHFLPGTNRIALMHERLAKLMCGALNLASTKPPFEIPLMDEVMQFHSTRAQDPGLIWLRHQLMEMANSESG